MPNETINRKPQEYFSTGEFAKLCGVNKRTLFHYHDIGLFYPAMIDQNGYRYYSYHQFNVFLIITVLKELDVPLKEMKVYLDERTPDRLLELSKQKIVEIDREIEKSLQIRHFLEETIAFTNKGMSADPDRIIVEEQEEECMIRSALLSDENSKDYIRWMLEYNKFTNSTRSKSSSFVGAMISKNKIMNGDFQGGSYLFAKTGSKNPTPSMAVKPKGLYAVAYHRGSYETINKTYEKLLMFLQENQLDLGDFAYEEYLLDEVAVKDKNDLVTQITVAVEKR
ncbi:MAG TPA: MerR family DNA-binding transcriptional regulator [Clostridia bacterium]|nr:MerR family DNA-binding transcriptional regulator [Clostridia bacterium]